MLYLVMSDEPQSFSPADHVDPEYGKALRKAQKAGVEIYVYTCITSELAIKLGKSIPYSL